MTRLAKRTRGEYNATDHLVPWAAVEKALQWYNVPQEVIQQVATAIAPKPITIRDASEKYGIPRGTLGRWVAVGIVTPVRRAGHPGPGAETLLDEREVEALNRHPPRRGPQPKSHKNGGKVVK